MNIDFSLFSSLSDDSRALLPNSIFLAYPGERVDGRQFIEAAIQKGAKCIIYETRDGWRPPQVTGLEFHGVDNLREKAGQIAAEFYGWPAKSLQMVGVTGTNGKTSVANFVAQGMNQHHKKCAVLGTLGNGFLPHLQKSSHTTLNPILLQKMLAEFVEQAADSVAMEVSSHALDQGRVNGIEFETAIFTNLSRDHLDYHGTLAAYFAAKSKLFHFPNLKYAVINYDDEHGEQLLQQRLEAQIFLYSAQNKIHKNLPTIAAEKISLSDHGFVVQVVSPWGRGEFESRLLGEFNVSNVLAVLTSLCVSGVPFFDALFYVSNLKPVAGRMQLFGGLQKPRVIVDYAHTPDALEKALLAMKAHCRGDLICVFGCGGDRDSGKRPLMAQIAEQLADQIILTNDNPRSEDPAKIVSDIQQGFSLSKKIQIILDRESAIYSAVQNANNNDMVLVAGKGHEDYQIIGNQTLAFDDSLVVQKALGEIKR